MYQIFISGYRLAEVSHGKPYYVYTVEMVDSSNGARHFVEKRYSEFNALHRLLKKESETAPFPPKRVRNSNPKVLEHRRAALEQYMQKMLKLSNTKHQVLNFLGLDSRSSGLNHKRMQRAIETEVKPTQRYLLQHRPVFHFDCDPYITADTTSTLPDIVTDGVLLGVYDSRDSE